MKSMKKALSANKVLGSLKRRTTGGESEPCAPAHVRASSIDASRERSEQRRGECP